MADRLLEVKDLAVEFRTGEGIVKAVRGVSFHVEKGEILGFAGESGSGKSVSAMACLGLLASNGTVTSGSIRFAGKELLLPKDSTRDQLRRHEEMLRRLRGNEISMIFQDPMTYLNPVLTIGTQLTEGILAHTQCSRREAWKKGIEMLRQVEISDPEKRMRQYPYEFSGGMRQRIIIAIAFSCDPQLLIADEPTTALDVTVQAQILDLIRKRAREKGTSVIMITHDLGVVASLCDRVAVLYGGRIEEAGTADEIFYEPRHPYTEGLLSSVSRRNSETMDKTPLTPIPGTTPDLLHMNSGCPFASRCPEAMKICKDYLPAISSFSRTHDAECWRYCRAQAQQLILKQMEERGERNE